MGQYEVLPVYRDAYDLLLIVYSRLYKVPRDYKFTLVQDLKKDLIDILTGIFVANSSFDKVPVIKDMRKTLVGVKVKVRLLSDMKLIDPKLFALMVDKEESVSKQLASWQKYYTQKPLKE